jgi:nicotinamide riboside transporter PnuC
MHFIEIFGWLATAIALAGVWMNNRRRRACFVLWLISNTITFGIHGGAGMWSMAARDIAFSLLAIHGWWLWGPLSAKKRITQPEPCQQDM